MVAPLVVPFVDVPVSFKAGDLVSNFGQIARVLEVDPERGLLVRPVGGTDRWFADPARCRPIR